MCLFWHSFVHTLYEKIIDWLRIPNGKIHGMLIKMKRNFYLCMHFTCTVFNCFGQWRQRQYLHIHTAHRFHRRLLTALFTQSMHCHIICIIWCWFFTFFNSSIFVCELSFLFFYSKWFKTLECIPFAKLCFNGKSLYGQNGIIFYTNDELTSTKVERNVHWFKNIAQEKKTTLFLLLSLLEA